MSDYILSFFKDKLVPRAFIFRGSVENVVALSDCIGPC